MIGASTLGRGQLSWRDYLLIVAFALLALAPGLSSLPPTDRDESRYAVASTQMLQSGDFIDIRFQEEKRYLQPAGIYWLQSGAVAAFSSPEAREIWAFRLPSLLGAVAAVLITGWIGGALFGRAAGIAAALLLASCFSLGFEARTAKTDAALLATITTAQAALLHLYLFPAGKAWRAGVFWAALGAGLMLKGPIILLVSGSTILALLVWDRRADWLRALRPAWGAPLFLAIVLPWYVAIAVVSDGEFFARSVGRNLLGKVGVSQQSHAGPPGYHLAHFVVSFWPGALFAALAVPFAWARRAEPRVRFLIAWTAPTWVIFELVATKLPHYVLPTYPAIAVLAGAALFGPPAPVKGWLRALGFVWAGLWVVASAVAAALAPAALYWAQGRIDPASVALGAAGFALACAALVLMARQRPRRALASAAAAGVLVWTNAFAVALPAMDRFWLSPAIAEAARAAAPCPDTRLITINYREPSLVFLHGPFRTRFADTPDDAAALLAQAPRCALALVDNPDRAAFEARVRALGAPVRPVGKVEGDNYSDGDTYRLTLYAAPGQGGP